MLTNSKLSGPCRHHSTTEHLKHYLALPASSTDFQFPLPSLLDVLQASSVWWREQWYLRQAVKRRSNSRSRHWKSYGCDQN